MGYYMCLSLFLYLLYHRVSSSRGGVEVILVLVSVAAPGFKVAHASGFVIAGVVAGGFAVVFTVF